MTQNIILDIMIYIVATIVFLLIILMGNLYYKKQRKSYGLILLSISGIFLIVSLSMFEYIFNKPRNSYVYFATMIISLLICMVSFVFGAKKFETEIKLKI